MENQKVTTLAKIGGGRSLTSLKVEGNKALADLVRMGQYDLEKHELSQVIIDPAVIQERTKCKSVAEVIDAKSISLGSLFAYQGKVKMLAALHLLIHQLSDFFSVGRGLNDKAIQMVCELIYEDFYYLTIEEIKFCFKEAMRGKYGELYDRLDGAIILKWLNLYASERMNAIEEKRRQEKRIKDQERINGAVPMPGWLVEKMKVFEGKKVEPLSVEDVKRDAIMMQHYQARYNESGLQDEGVTFENFLYYEIKKINR